LLKDIFVSEKQMKEQIEYSEKVKSLLCVRYPDKKPKAFTHTYGCQGNVADGERIRGMLAAMGYDLTNSPENADLVLYNTCAIREHAENRVFGNIGALKKYKKQNPGMVIAVCGCMAQQSYVAQKIEKSFPYVDLVFGTHALHRLPELLSKTLCRGKRIIDATESDGVIAEGLPVARDNNTDVFLPIMYGCDNFCSYCVVPLVRGRERSRRPEEIIKEAGDIIAGGARLITLLGQNVNSYGKGSESDTDFSDLIRMLDALSGDFQFDFMTSHPKDCSKKLIDTLAGSKHYCRHLHLPVQCGSDRILKAMNRGYTRAQYLSLIELVKNRMPDISLTTDIIVGFPSETYEEFCQTLSLVEKVRYDSMYTFVFSPRKGTKAYEMEDAVPKSEKMKWFSQLLKLQEKIQKEKQKIKKNNPNGMLIN